MTNLTRAIVVPASAAAGGSGYTTIQDEGTPLTQRTTINFVGAGVVATDAGGITVVTIAGGGGSVPTGTGFVHVTAGAQDAAAKLVDTADVNNDQITYAKIQNVAANNRILGRVSGAAGDIEELTGTQVAVVVDAMVGDSGAGGTKGEVPAPGAGDAAAGKFLKADATWAVPGGVANPVSRLSTDFTDHATTGTTEESLFAYSVPAGTLASNGQLIKFRALYTSANVNAKTLLIKFGATTVMTVSAPNAQEFILEGEIIRTGAATQRAGASAIRQNAVVSTLLTAPGETLSGAITLDFKATTGVAAGDATLRYAMVWLAA